MPPRPSLDLDANHTLVRRQSCATVMASTDSMMRMATPMMPVSIPVRRVARVRSVMIAVVMIAVMVRAKMQAKRSESQVLRSGRPDI